MDRKRPKKEGKARKQILTALLATIPTFTYGIQIGWLSPMAHQLKTANNQTREALTDDNIMWMAAALPLAAIVGIPFFSCASDKIGRKFCIIGVSLLSCISWTIKLLAKTPTIFILARAVAGLAAGGCFVVIPAYVKEIAEDSWRGALGSLTMTVCKLGVIFVYIVGMLASYEVNQSVYLGVAGVHVILFYFMPESPNYLVKIGKEKKAAKIISWLRSLKPDHRIVVNEIKKLKKETNKESSKVTISRVVKDRSAFAALRMTLVLMGMQTLSGCFALMNYAADVFKRAGSEWDPNTLAIFVGTLQLAGSFFTTMSVEKCGRRLPLGCSSLVVSVSMGTLGSCFLMGIDSSSKWMPVTAMCVGIFAYGVGLAPIPFVIMAEVFVYELRARMAGVAMAFSFFCSAMTVLFYTPVANLAGEYVVFYTFAVITLLGAIYTVYCVPETKGKSLEEIQQYWKKEPDPVQV